jgi:hypothetical protein
MTDALALPEASAPREFIADWLELRTITETERSTSYRDLIRDYKIGGVIDALDEWEEGDDIDSDEDAACEVLADKVFNEISERQTACGGPGGVYPFEVGSNLVQGRPDAESSIYMFLALLSRFGKDAGPKGTSGAKIFEDVCARAAAVYLGAADSPNVHSHVFGFPRRVLPTGFRPALDKLCADLGEGIGHRPEREETPDQKDAKLDIVVWREFEDRRPGKLIAFGQCATGNDWKQKISELPPTKDWWTVWLRDRAYAWPIRLFFIPHRIEFKHWLSVHAYGGILFDRCRIAQLAARLDPEVEQSCIQWSEHVLQEKLRK